MSDRDWERIPAEEEKAWAGAKVSAPEASRIPAAIDAAENEIARTLKEVRYIVREYPASVLVDKYLTGIAKGTNEIFVPDYQRELIWPFRIKCRFIESILIGLPIPFIFVADIGDEDPATAGRLEIVDGVQRIRTLAQFMSGGLVLDGLEKLPALNGSTFFDLVPSRQKRFSRSTLRLIEMTETVTEDVRRDLFDRVNSGSVGLTAVETRRGVHKGPFSTMVEELSRSPLLKTLAPISPASEKRYEYEELVTRYFAFLDRYERFGTGASGKVVRDFLEEYVSDMNAAMEADAALEARMRREFDAMLAFAEANYPNGFAKRSSGRKVPRVRFEALAVGAGLALRKDPGLTPRDIGAWLDKPRFDELTTSDASNNRKALVQRLEYVRDRLLDER